MQLPNNVAFNSTGYPFSLASSANLDTGLAKSGECGPTTCGSRADRSISRISSKYRSGDSYTSGSATSIVLLASASLATSSRSVILR